MVKINSSTSNSKAMKNRFPYLNRVTLGFLAMFLILALSFDIVFTKWIILQSELSNESKVHRLLTYDAPNEIPVFGSSKSRSGFIPDSLGEEVYNYGMEKCGFDVVNFLLEVELSKDKSSPIYIEYNHRSFISSPSHSINAATYVPNIQHPEVETFLTKNDAMEMRYHLPGLRYYGSYVYYLRYFLKGNAGSRKTVSKGGVFTSYQLSERVFTTLVNNRLKMINERSTLEHAANTTEEVISAAGRKKLENLNAYLKFSYSQKLVERFKELAAAHPNRPIYLIQTPRHWSETKGIENLDEMNAFYQAIDDAVANVHVLDFSGLPLLDTDYKNTSHLNLYGAQKFNSALRKQLEKMQ